MKRPEVTYADRICALIKNEEPEPDEDYKDYSEAEIIAAEKKRVPDDDSDEDQHPHGYCHTQDGISNGSHIMHQGRLVYGWGNRDRTEREKRPLKRSS
jgi:hypothetical protein